MDLSKPLTQEAFGQLVGISQQAVGEMVNQEILPRGATGDVWLLAYCERLREQAAGRASTESLALMRANTELAISRKRSQDIKNEVADKRYAPIELLTEVLAGASQAAATHIDALVPTLMREGLELTDSQRTRIATIVARARNELVERATDIALLDLFDEQEGDVTANTNESIDADTSDLPAP